MNLKQIGGAVALAALSTLASSQAFAGAGAVADAVEAISADRPYRPSLGLARASEEIVTHSGSHYDPQVVAACLEVIHLPWQSYVADSTLPILSVAA